MNARRAFRSIAHPLAVLLVAPWVEGAAQGGACCSRPLVTGRPTTAVVAWPAAPEAARISFAGTLASEFDVGKKTTGLDRFRQVVAGTRPAARSIERPHDVWVDASHRLYVSDGTARTVVRFDPELRAAVTIGGDGPGRLVKPLGLAGDSRGNLYVADQAAKRVVVFDAMGAFVRAIGGSQVLLNPVDVAVDGSGGTVYVADSYLHQVLVFAPDGRLVRRLGRDQGNLERKLQLLANVAPAAARTAEASHLAGGVSTEASGAAMFGHAPKYLPEPRDLVENRGARPGEFRYPAFLAVGGDGTLYVSDGMNFRVQAFDRTGKYLRSFGALGDGPGNFARPKGVAVDSEGHVYVADAAFNNVQVFDTNGRLLLPFGQMGRGAGELWLPLGLAIDTDDHVYVADR
ncbi:MAG TPA: 6-bladed beta-propeller, partial [Gemmatimonadaceae bacterium]|nr:6-bladed beta-propeller [Gemmatimonadaceae bacterium]